MVQVTHLVSCVLSIRPSQEEGGEGGVWCHGQPRNTSCNPCSCESVRFMYNVFVLPAGNNTLHECTHTDLIGTQTAAVRLHISYSPNRHISRYWISLTI